MAITNRKQALAQELIEELGDKQPKAFGMYMGLIKRFGESKVRQVLSEVKHDYATGKISNKVKIFMFRIKGRQNNGFNQVEGYSGY